MGALVLKFSPMDLHEFLLSPVAYLAPEKTLDGLSPAHADRRIAGTSHSIAELVAHMSFWQDWFYSRCQGNAVPPAATAAQGWPAVTSGTWPDIRSRFVTRLNEIAKLAETNTSRPITPAIEFPPLAHYTIADALVHIATHNSHHLGQVITLRQIMGTWPPPAGSWTW
jgi:uncharacterized damage-inducible protein DinB